VLYQAEPRPDWKGFRCNRLRKGFTLRFYTTCELSDETPSSYARPDSCGRLSPHSCSLIQIPPVRSNAHLDLEGHRQFVGLLHVLADELFHGIHLVLRNFKHEFVVHL
jgi:hypothetical protein